MSIEVIMCMYKGTETIAPIAKGIKGKFVNGMLDCDCIDCGSSSDCSNCDSPGTTH